MNNSLPTRARPGIALAAAVSALLALTSIALGGVHPWAYRSAAAFVFLLLAAWFARASGRRVSRLGRTPLVWSLPGAAAAVVMYVLPLPARLVEAVSPGRAVMRAAAGADSSWDTLALYPAAALDRGIFVTGVLALFLMVATGVRSRAGARLVVSAALMTGALFCVSAFAQYSLVVCGSFLPFVNRNHFAGYVAAIVPLAASGIFFNDVRRPARGLEGFRDRVICSLSSREAAGTVVAALLAALLAAGVFLSASRGGILAMGISLAALAALAAARGRRAGPLIITVALLLAVGLNSADRGLVAERFGSLMDAAAGRAADGSAALRKTIWRDTASMVAGFTAVGVGPGGFAAAYPLYRTLPPGPDVLQPESDYLYVLAEGGVLGFTIAAVFFGLFVASSLRGLLRARDAFTARVIAGSLCGLAALMTHGLVDTGLHLPAILILAAVLAGLSASASAGWEDDGEAARARPHPGRRGRALAVSGAAAFFCLSLFLAAGAAGDFIYRGAVGGDRDGATDAIARLKAASMLDPGSAEVRFEAGMAYMAAAEMASGREREDLFRLSLAQFERSLARNPYSSFAHLMAGRALEMGHGSPAAGRAHYAAAMRLNPSSRLIREYLAGYARAERRMRRTTDQGTGTDIDKP